MEETRKLTIDHIRVQAGGNPQFMGILVGMILTDDSFAQLVADFINEGADQDRIGIDAEIAEANYQQSIENLNRDNDIIVPEGED